MRLAVVLLLGIALSCSRSQQKESSKAQTAAATPPPPPAPSAPAAPVSAEPAAAPAPSAKNTVSGEGISIIEASDGTVIFKAKSTFNDTLDTTYENCTFFTKAIPVLKLQLTDEQAKLLLKVCKKP